MFDRRPEAGSAEDRAGEMLARHGEVLMRVARKVSLCADDAQDAVQRAMEIYMRRLSSLDPATELAWLKVVVRNEALAVRRGRAGVAGEEVDLDAVPAVAQRSIEERLESAERVARSAEIMRRLKRDEARALMLKAEGLSYVEIGERLGWTYTKVNRSITEGRRRFMKLYRELETGQECERLAPLLGALAAGTASSEALLELRPHLRNCAGCRATVRTLHASRLGRLAALLPPGAIVAPVRGVVERWRGGSEDPELHPMEREKELDEIFRRIHQGEVVAQPATGSVASSVERLSGARLNPRGWVEGALQRLQSSDLAMSLHAATSGGGGRIASLAALLGVCVSGVGAGTYCVATALFPDPHPAAVRAEAKHRPDGLKRRDRRPSRESSPVATAQPASARVPSVHTVRVTRSVSHETRRNGKRRNGRSSDEFSFETGGGAAASAPPPPSAGARSTSPASSTSFESGASSVPAPRPRGEFDAGSEGEFTP